MSVSEEHVLEGLGCHSAAACIAAEFAGNLFGIPCGAVNGDDVRQSARVLKGDAVGVRDARSAEEWVLVGKDVSDLSAFVGAKDAT